MEKQTKDNQNDRFQKANSIILNNDHFLIAVDGNNFDSLNAGAGLALLLTSMDKQVALYSPVPAREEYLSSIQGLENLTTKLDSTGSKLTISFNYPLEKIERVSSSDENDKLKLVVEFKEDAEPADPSQVGVERSGPEFKAGFVIGTDLGEKGRDLFKQGRWVWIAKAGSVKDWAEVNLIEPKASLSESTISLVSRGNFDIPDSAAGNFYTGIKVATNNFSQADSIALETAAYCLRIKESRDGSQKPGKKIVQPDETVDQEQKDVKIKPQATEAKEGSLSNLKKPPIFTGTTTPKV